VLKQGILVVDTRKATLYAESHVPDTINIPLNKSFTNWAGALIPFDRDFYLIVDGNEDTVREAVSDLAMIGLDRVIGWFPANAVEKFTGAKESTTQVSVQTFKNAQPFVLDVRGRSEWDAGHMPDATNIPLAELPDRLKEVPRDTPIVVHCQGGGRSAIAASLLKADGIEDVSNLTGGYGEWAKQNRPK
jgi:hydroxyacylglutathione hydrolase